MQHIIQHQLFDIVYTNAGRAYDLQSKISDIFNNRLVAGMEQLFDRLVPEDTVLSLDEVNIDIGSITYNKLDYDLVDRILAELEREIKYRLLLGQGSAIEGADKQRQESVKSLQASYADLLEYFLLTGTMPWWATGELMLDPLKVMEQLLIGDAAGLKQLIIRVGQHGYVRQRIVYQFSDRVIRQIVTLLEPAEAVFIFDYHATAVKIHSEQKLVDSAPNNEFEKSLWLFILTYLLVDRGSLFNQKTFVRSTLGQMAQHYNRAYAELLMLLNKVLNNERLRTQQSGYLPLIIQELFSEESDIGYINDDVTGNVYNEEGASGQDIELIRHYLAFGSLPWWADPYTKDDIAGLFMNLIKAAPKTLRAVVISVGQNEALRKRMVAVFDDDVIESVIRLLEPANARFIINYVTEVQQLHVKKVVVQTDSKDFKKAVWKFVLDFLLTERGSEFNQKMFLQSNIKKLADNYNVQYRDVLLYFVQSISQLHQGSIEHAPLFKLLASLLQEDPQASIAALKSSGTLNNGISKQINDEQHVVVLKDILLHWLKYGNMPWWGKEYFDWTPAAMFESLFTTSPTDVALLLKYAATTVNMQQRIMYQLPPQFMLDVLKLYPQGDHAVKLYRYLSELLPTLIKSKQTDPEKVQKELMLILWNIFNQGQYRDFDAVAFLSTVVNHLSQKHNIQPSATLKALKVKFNTLDGQAYTQLLNKLPANTYTINDWVTALADDGADVYLLIKDHLDREHASESYIINEAFNILAFFIANNKLPEQFKGTNPAYVNAIVKQLLQFLNKADSIRLTQVLNTSGRPELQSLIETDQASAQIDGGIEQIITAYLTGNKSQQTGTLVSEALHILEYYLVNGNMPEYLSRIDVHVTLKQLLVWLNYKEQSALNSLLQKDGHAVAARMQLHNAFAKPLNTAESNISNTLRTYFERDVISYLKQTAATNFNIKNDSKLAELLDPYISKLQNTAFIIALLKHTAVARHIALNYTDDVVFNLLSQQNNSVGGNENVEWIKQLQHFFNAGFTDTLLRDRFNNLLKEFNLLILGEHVTAKTPEAYLKALFSFISSANNTLFVQLSKILPTIDINSPIALKLPLLSETVKQQQQADDAVRQVKQSLKEADEQAIKRATQTDDTNNAEATNDMDKEKDSLVNSKDTIYINNAGLVLLNPFFATYFIRLGMMKEGKFIDTDTQHRAVHLLQYLVNSEEQSPEHTLVLNKILCNVPVAEAIPLGITITENEKQVSADLLKAVTERWEKMQNTSIPGFQASFLQRSGALVYKDDAWHLRVEQRGYDVLLQTLPWNIGMIKTPWMDNFLYVEWT